MTYFQWNENAFHLDLPKMDAQHRGLIDAMNHIYDLISSRAEQPTIAHAIGLLRELVVTHFRDEEAYMDSINFPKRVEHQDIHRRLLLQLDHYVDRFEKGDSRVTAELVQFLYIWLAQHIKGTDREYSHVHGA